MRHWLLPESIEDILPAEARAIEGLRRRLLDNFAAHGFELVVPPMLEYLESLVSVGGEDIKLRTFKLVDQLNGRTMGVRPDITPQAARIDAHLLNRQGVTRLCYCGPVMHTLPASLTATREPLQIGAEIFGHGGLEADVDILRLLGETLALIGLAASRIDIGHVGVFHALAAKAALSAEAEAEFLDAMRGKDVPALRELAAALPESLRDAFVALPGLYGGSEVLAAARRILPPLPEIAAALDTLDALRGAAPELPLSFDLADLRGYHYHSGMVFAAYAAGLSGALALGGRYDAVGKMFGRSRPATGFSLDLREAAALLPVAAAGAAIAAPWAADAALRQRIAQLRGAGETVVEIYPGQDVTAREAGCTRQLVHDGGRWEIRSIT